MKNPILTVFGFTMLGTSMSLSACPKTDAVPRPLPAQTAEDVARGLDLAGQVADVVAAAVAHRSTREGCIVSKVAGPALKAAAVGVRAGATRVPVLPALDLDLTMCGDPSVYPVSDDVAPWVEVWAAVVGLVKVEIDAGGNPQTCVAREVSSAVLGWVAGDLSVEVANELIQGTADGLIMIDEQTIDLNMCGG